MAKSPPSFVCQNCGAASNRWQGKCESCGEWNTLVEESAAGAASVPNSLRPKRKGRAFALESLTGDTHDAPRAVAVRMRDTDERVRFDTALTADRRPAFQAEIRSQPDLCA